MSGNCSPKWVKIFKEFPVEDLFSIQVVSHKLSKSDLESNAKYPCYSSDTNNNGILGYTSSPDFYVSKDVKTYVIFGDHTRTFNIATTDFSVLDNVKVLVPPTNNIEAIMFMTSVWKKQVPNRGYARHWSLAKQAALNLPVDSDGNPDFEYMERYIRAIEKAVIADVVAYKNKVIESTKKVADAPEGSSL